MSEASVIQVFVFREGNYVGNEVFTEPEIVIGNGEGVDLSLDDDAVAHNHALLSHENGQATLLKLGGARLMINRTEIEHSYVTARDEIQIGSHTLKIKFLSANKLSRGPQPAAASSQAPQKSRSPAPSTAWDPNPAAPPQVVSRGAPTSIGRSRRVDPGLSVQVPAGFVEDLTTEQLTERIDTKSANMPMPMASDRKMIRSVQPSVSLFEEKTLPPEEGRSPLQFDDLGRAPSQPTSGSIEITGSDVVAIRGVGQLADSGGIDRRDPRRQDRRGGPPRSKEEAPSSPGIDGVWDEGNGPEDEGVGLENLEADHLEMALDAAFTGGNRPRDPQPRIPHSDLKLPLVRPQQPKPQVIAPPSRHFANEARAPRNLADEGRAPQAPAYAPPPAAAKSPAYIPDTIPSLGPPVSPIDFLPEREEKTAPRPQPAFAAPIARILPMGPEKLLGFEGEELDEYEIEERIRPDYSLVDTLLQSAGAANVAVLEERQALEVIAFTKEGVRASSLLKKKGARFVLGKGPRGKEVPRAGYPGLRLATLLREGSAQIEFPTVAEGFVQGADRRMRLDELKVPTNAVSKKGNAFSTELRIGQVAVINLPEMSFHLRFVRPPAVPKDRKGFAVDRSIARSVFSSVGVHLVVAFLIGITAPGVSYSDQAREMWSDPAHEQVREVELKPEPKPEPEPEPAKEEKAPEPEKPEPPPKHAPKVKPEKRARPARGGTPEPAPPPKEDIKTVGVLGAMGKLNIAAPGKKSMVQAVSNIDAVRAPGGSSFRVGALIGKLPSSQVSVGGGGGGTMLTRGGAELLRGGDGIAQLGRRDSGKVRGSVTHASARQVDAKGSISREEVAAVINAHLKEVQYCYEKTLLKDPGLTGKLILEWTIDTNGSVGRVKEKLSTLRNPAVSSCISSSLKRWQFPKPRGGIVIVSYPFIFNAVGF
jgi:FHA domain-containing protein